MPNYWACYDDWVICFLRLFHLRVIDGYRGQICMAMFAPVAREHRSPWDVVGLLLPYCRERARQQKDSGLCFGASEAMLLRVSSSCLDLLNVGCPWFRPRRSVLQALSAIFSLGLLRSVLGSSWTGRICLALFSLLPSGLFAKVPSDACWEPCLGDASGVSQLR